MRNGLTMIFYISGLFVVGGFCRWDFCCRWGFCHAFELGMCYAKVWKYIIVICSLVFCRGFLIPCAVLVIDIEICIHDYAHSLFRGNFQSNALYWLYLWSLVLRSGFWIQCAILVISMIMLTRSSEWIFNSMRFTGYVYDYAHSFFFINEERRSISVKGSCNLKSLMFVPYSDQRQPGRFYGDALPY